MTSQKKLKRAARERQRRDGMSYAVARRIEEARRKRNRDAAPGLNPVEPIVFTDELMNDAASAPRHAAALRTRWAARAGERAEAVRSQIERAAAWVPVDQRPRVLGPLLSKSAPDDQVRACLGSLLLGKSLSDLGWGVQLEPTVDGVTPDLLIRKGAEEFLVEVRRIPPRERPENERALARVRDSLDDLRTHTPISLRAVSVDGQASLAGFRAHVDALLAEPHVPKGPQTFQEQGVFVAFDVHKRYPEPMPGVIGLPNRVYHGNQHAEVRAALDEKLRKYKVPIIIALDFFDWFDPFRVVEEVLLGTEVMRIPIDMNGSGAAGEPYAARAEDSILIQRDSTGRRARGRLQAVLAFSLLVEQETGEYELRARAFCNPAAELPPPLREFAPMPRLVVVDETPTERRLAYRAKGSRGVKTDQLNRWRHVP
jgi:hypothetical protein